MNRIVTLSIIFFLGITGAKAQKIDYENSGKWFLGLNVGGTWQTSDIKNKTNVGYGVVLGKSFNYNYGKRLVFDLRARYLRGEWYGKNADLDSTYFPVNATTDTIYGINNFLSTQNRLALEFAIHANRIRERTGLDPYIFGGIGLTWTSTYADYYNTLDSVQTLGTDGIYETELTAVNKVSLMPSLGFGLGYQIGKRTTIGIEHKTTFTGYDLYDGLQSPIRGGKDLYHYTSFFVNFRFKSHTNSSGGTNTIGGGTNGSGNIDNYNTTQGCISPVVTYIQPAGNSAAANQTTHVSATITNTIDRNNIIFKINGVASTNFTYTSQSNRFDADILLQQGTNTIEITATNTCGSDVEVTTVNYQPCLTPIVLFTDPVATNMSVSSTTYSIQADIYHVTDRNNIAFTVNGMANNMFTFDVQTGKFTATINLVENNNVIELSALTACGKDGKNTTIIRKTCQMPVITLTSPTASGMTVRTANLALSFKAQHVAAKPNVSISLNGQTISSYTFNASSGVGTANLGLIPGVNTIVITSSNGCGTDTETITVNYDNCVPPTVNITNPTMNNATFTNPQISLLAVTQNITNTQGVSITVNNQSISNFTLNTANGQIQSGITLNPGLNVIAVTVVNGCGTDIKTINVNYKVCTPPSIQITNPVMNGSTVNTPVFAITGSFQNITSAQNVTIQQNGRPTSGLSFNAQTGLFAANVNLNNGANSFTISVVNECGTASETILINYTAPVNNTPQMITICHYPPGNNGNPQTIEIPLSAWPAHQAHGDVLGPCPVVTPPCNPPAILVTSPTQNGQTVQQASYAITASIANIANNQGINYVVNGKPITNFGFLNGVFSNTVNLVNGWNTFIITATNGCGSVTETITINYSAPVDNTPQMITICHYPPGNNGNPQTLEIPLASWPAHQAHGDVLGPCPVVNTPPCNPPSIQVTNPAQNGQTVQQPSFTVTANMSNIANNQGISCLFNGMPMSSFVYANGSFSANVSLISGTNNIVLTAVNACGADTEMIAVNYSAPVDNTPQKVTICHYPPGNSGNPQTIEIPLSAWPAHQAHGDVLGPCPVVNTPPCNPPSIQVTNPSQNGQTVQQQAFTVSANMSNIANNQGISCLFNGMPMSSFVYANGSFSANVNLTLGANTIVLTAVNSCGTDTETISVNYSAPVDNTPQKVTICHYPPGNSGNPQTIEIPLSAWPAHQAHGDVLGPCPPINNQNGNNDDDDDDDDDDENDSRQKVTICHKSGNTSQTMEIPLSAWPAHQAHGDVMGECPPVNPTPPCNPPKIQVTNPLQSGQTVQQSSFNITANISSITNNQGIVYTMNGQPMTGFSFNNGSFSNSVNLISGLNTFTITATNGCGMDSETITINYLVPLPQMMTICHKGNRTQETMEIPVSEWPAHQAHGDVMGACPPVNPTPPCNPPSIQVTNPLQSGQTVQKASLNITANISNIVNNQGIVYTMNGKPMTGFSFNNGSFSNSVNLSTGLNTFTITATNACGTDTETITINYAEPVEQKVVICHKSGNTTQTLEIPMSAWPAHQAHGDVLGPCPTTKPTENGGQSGGEGEHEEGENQHQNNGSGGQNPTKPEIKPTNGGKGETENEQKEEENKEIKPGEGKVQGKGRG